MFLSRYVPEEAREPFFRDMLSALAVGVLLGSVNPFINFIARDRLHAGDAVIGLLVALPFAGMILAGIYARFTKKADQIKAVFWPLFIGRLTLVLVPLSASAALYCVFIAPMMLSGTMVSPCYAAVMTSIYPLRSRGKLMAMVRMGMCLMALITTQCVGMLLKSYPGSYKLIFAVGGVFGAISALGFRTIKPVAPFECANNISDKSSLHYFRNLYRMLAEDSPYRYFMIGTFLFGFGNILLITHIPIYQVDHMHITGQQVAVLANVATIFWMLSYPFWGKYVDTRSPVKATIINILLASLIPINYMLVSNPWYLIPSAAISGFITSGVELSYFSGIIYFTKSGYTAEYQSIFSILGGLRGIIAPFCVPLLLALSRTYDIDYRFLFGLYSAMIASGAIVMFFTMRVYLKPGHAHASETVTVAGV